MKIKRLLLVVVLLAFCSCMVNFIKAQEEESHTFQAAGYTRVEIETENGTITSSAQPGDSIDVTLNKWATGSSEAAAKAHIQDISVSITEDTAAGKLRIFVAIPKQITRAYGCDATLSLPPSLYVNLVTSNGDIEAQGHEAGLLLYTSNGAITSTATKGNEELTTSNGDITVNSHIGNIDAATSNGAIDAKVIMPDLKGHLRLVTSNGNARATIPASVSASIALRTSNGSISIDPALNITVIKINDDEFEGTMGGTEDQGDVDIETSNGTVVLSRYVP